MDKTTNNLDRALWDSPKDRASHLSGCVFPGARSSKRKDKMSIKQFIRDNRETLDAAIAKARNVGREHNPIEAPPLNDNDRHEWILNEPGLYSWARSEGVRV